MSISLQTTAPTQQQNPYQGIRSQVRQDVETLDTALQSGDLKSAQTSFADLQKLLQSSGAIGAATSSSSTANPILKDFQSLGQDLSSGNLAGAQKDFAQLQTDSTAAIQQQASSGQVGGHHHHHHHGGAPPAAQPASSLTDPASDPTAATPSQPQSVSVIA